MKRKPSLPIDEGLALAAYNAGLLDWEIAVRCDCDARAICRWRNLKALPPNVRGRNRIDENQALSLYGQGMTDMQMALRLRVERESITAWRHRRNLAPNGERLQMYRSPEEPLVPEPVEVRREGGILVKVYQPMFCDGYWGQPNVRPRRLME